METQRRSHPHIISRYIINFIQIYLISIFIFSLDCPSYLSFKAKAERKSVTSRRMSPLAKPVKSAKDTEATIRKPLNATPFEEILPIELNGSQSSSSASRFSPYSIPFKKNNTTEIKTATPLNDPLLPLAILPVQFDGCHLGALHNDDGLMDVDEAVTPAEIDFSLQLSKMVLPMGWTSTKCDYFLADSRYKPGNPLLINLCFDGGKLTMKKAILVVGCSLIYYVLGEPFRGRL